MSPTEFLATATKTPSPLSAAEDTAMLHLALGLTVHEAARARHVSHRTIRGQRESAYRKLGARNGPHAVGIWLAGGWGEILRTTHITREGQSRAIVAEARCGPPQAPIGGCRAHPQ